MKNSNPCKNCDKCCKHIALEIDKPETKKDFENIRWYILHKNVFIFIGHDNKWYIEFKTKCKKLKNSLCSIYEKRPSICRRYSAENCEEHGGGSAYKKLFKNLNDFEDWISARN